ncbi:MAG: hypothetical protein U0166_14475 [Acidobacteriota bacterium]
MRVPRATLALLALGGLLGCAHRSAGKPPETAAAAPAAPAAAKKNTLKWTTASEVNNYGYDIYRGESEGGPFQKMTVEPIAGAGTTDTVSSYEWVDQTADPRKAYWYYVESITLQGQRERFTPIVRKGPRDSAAGSEAPRTEPEAR